MERRNLIVEFVPTEKQKEQVEEMYRLHNEGKRRAKFGISATRKKEELKIRSSYVSGVLMEMTDPEIRQSLLADPAMSRFLVVHQFLKERDTYFAECTLLMPPVPRPYNRDVPLHVKEIQGKLTQEELEELEALMGCEAVELRLEDDCVNVYYNDKLLGEAEGYEVEAVKGFLKMGFDVWGNSIYLDIRRDGRINFDIRVYANARKFSEIDAVLKEYPIEHIEKAYFLLKMAGLNPNSDEWDVLADDVIHIDREKLKNLPEHKHPRVAEAFRERMRKATATNPTNPEFQMGVSYDFDIYGITWDDIKIENKDLILQLISDNYILALFIRHKRKNFALTVEEFIKEAEPHFGTFSETVRKRIERFNAPYNFG